MKCFSYQDVLSPTEEETIHRNALKILEEVGLEVQHHRLLDVMAQADLKVDKTIRRVRFPRQYVEDYLAKIQKKDWALAKPQIVYSNAGIYESKYLVPGTNKIETWTEERLKNYNKLADALEEVNDVGMLGCPLHSDSMAQSLYTRYYSWKYGNGHSGTIYPTEICPYLIELYEIHAAATGKKVQDIICAGAFLVPPLRFMAEEAKQFVYFWDRGFEVELYTMHAMGITAPVTPAGAAALNIAEQIACSIIIFACYGTRTLSFNTMVSPLDMKTMIRPFGRSEMSIVNSIVGQMARRYGANFAGQSGLTEAKLPCTEAGMQKALTVISTLFTTGIAGIDMGLLSIDELCSPIQMILDNELISAIKMFMREYEVSNESIGFDTIKQVGPGGLFIDTEHTSKNFRSVLWQPTVWSQTMLGDWMSSGRKLDVDAAYDIYNEIIKSPDPEPCISDDEERAILDLIKRAREKLENS